MTHYETDKTISCLVVDRKRHGANSSIFFSPENNLKISNTVKSIASKKIGQRIDVPIDEIRIIMNNEYNVDPDKSLDEINRRVVNQALDIIYRNYTSRHYNKHAVRNDLQTRLLKEPQNQVNDFDLSSYYNRNRLASSKRSTRTESSSANQFSLRRNRYGYETSRVFRR
ncbi:MAG: hypothetical protein N2B06_04850 [Clostridium sp.]